MLRNLLHRSHIFANGTNFSKIRDTDQRISLLNALDLDVMRQYLSDLYLDESDPSTPSVFQQEQFEQMFSRKSQQFSVLDRLRSELELNPVPSADLEGALCAAFSSLNALAKENDYNHLVVEFLRDDSMGNMALLERTDNSGVSNKDYEDKGDIIRQKVSKGSFVPICTMNVFYGVYSQKNSNSLWLPEQRQSYLDSMCNYVCDYFADKSHQGGNHI